METLFIYLIKSSGLIVVFYLAYHFLVRKETFFTSNRWFLIAGLFTSLLLPLFTITKVIYVAKPKINLEDLASYSQVTSGTYHEVPVVETFDWMQLIWISYMLIAAFLVIKIIFNLISLYRMLYQQQNVKNEKFTLVDLNHDIAPFSFFNYIVFNSNLYSNEELQSILLHEKIHSQELHSFDVMVAKLFSIVFWFNPFVWLYKKAIIQNLEYIADQKAVSQLQDTKVYQRALLKVVTNQNCLAITNNFYQSLIKKRIVMLNKIQSNKRNSWKYALIIPALLGFVLLFQIKTIAQEKKVSIINQIKETHEGGEITFDAKESDKSLSTLTNVFKEEKITTAVSKIKRNSAGEITGIQIKMKSEDGRKKELKINQSTPIDKIFIYTNRMENGIYDFGVKHVTAEEIKAIKNKIDRKRIVSISKNGEDAFAFNFNDSIPELKDFNFDFEIPELPEIPESPEAVEAPEFPKVPELPNHFWNDADTETKIIVKKDGAKPLVILNGKVIEGDESVISKKELDELIDSSSKSADSGKKYVYINWNDAMKMQTDAMANARIQIKRMKPQIKEEMEKHKEIVRKEMKRVSAEMERIKPEMEKARIEMERSNPDMEKAKTEMIQAKAEMLKAKAELDAARAELEKAKVELKKNSK